MSLHYYKITDILRNNDGFTTLGLDERHITIQVHDRWFGQEGIITKFGPRQPGKEEMPVQFFRYDYKTPAHEVLHLITHSLSLTIGLVWLLFYMYE